MSPQRWDPNPNRGRASFFDISISVVLVLINLPRYFVQVCFRRLFHSTTLPFGTDLGRSILRNATAVVPLTFKRMLLTPSNIPQILRSNRFRSLPGPLCEEVLEEHLAGFWICRGLKKTLDPKDCDLVVLYMHGGAFVLGHPLLATTSYLRIAEVAEENGFTVAIFAVNYSLAPEVKLPKQQDQVVAAYRYLIERMDVAPAKIVLHGQSAGGWLALSLLQDLNSRLLPKPGAAWLLYPWLDLTNSKPSMERNKHKDTLSKTNLDRSAQVFLGDDETAVRDFTRIGGLGTLLPSYTWVTVGTHDLFIDSIVEFVDVAQKDGASIDIVTHEGGCHAWDATADIRDAKKYLNLDPGSETGKLMKGAEHMADGLVQIRKKLLKNCDRVGK